MTVVDRTDKSEFGKSFLIEYLQNGFSNMPKREIDLLVLRLLLEHVEGWSLDEPPNAFVLAQSLRAKRGRLRSMLDELSFRASSDEERSKKRLRSLLDKAEKDIENNKVRLQIEDGYLREYAKNLIQSDFGIVDTSFDRSIVVLSGDRFLLLVTEIMDAEAREAMAKELARHERQLTKENSKDSKEGLLMTFLRSFVESAGTEAGKKAIKLGSAALTGGLSEIPEIIESFLGPGDEADSSETNVST